MADEFSAELADGVAFVSGHDDDGRPVVVRTPFRDAQILPIVCGYTPGVSQKLLMSSDWNLLLFCRCFESGRTTPSSTRRNRKNYCSSSTHQIRRFLLSSFSVPSLPAAE